MYLDIMELLDITKVHNYKDPFRAGLNTNLHSNKIHRRQNKKRPVVLGRYKKR
jgi:hypothetical protein